MTRDCRVVLNSTLQFSVVVVVVRAPQALPPRLGQLGPTELVLLVRNRGAHIPVVPLVRLRLARLVAFRPHVPRQLFDALLPRDGEQLLSPAASARTRLVASISFCDTSVTSIRRCEKYEFLMPARPLDL